MRTVPLEVTATDLHDAYEDNEVTADGRYHDRLLHVTGTIDAVKKDLMGDPMVMLRASRFREVIATGLPPQIAGQLRKGRRVTLACMGYGVSLGSPVLADCRVQP